MQLQEAQKIRIPSDLKRNLMLLHSYVIVKTLVKTMNDHETSARCHHSRRLYPPCQGVNLWWHG